MTKRHHPFHLYLDDTVYFLTARVYGKRPLLNTDAKKRMLLDTINEVFSEFGFKLYAWVILNNHYHIEFRTSVGCNLPKAFQYIHGGCSHKMNKLDDCRGRKVFQNFWDHCIRDECDFYVHFNYAHHNPIKHGYVREMGEYRFSSYQYWCRKKGEEWLLSCFRDYPIHDFTLVQDDDV